MTDKSFFYGALLSFAMVAACSKAADEHEKAVNAQSEANSKISEATREANEKTLNAQTQAENKIAAVNKEADEKVQAAQVEADKKLADAHTNFQKIREDYRHDANTHLLELDKKIAKLDAKEKKATGKALTDLKAQLHQIRISREAFEAELKTLENKTAATWDDAKLHLDKQWEELKTLVDEP